MKELKDLFSRFLKNLHITLLFFVVIGFFGWFAIKLMVILENRALPSYISHVPVSTLAIDSLKTDSITRQLLIDNRTALEGYRSVEQSFSILQSASGIIEIALAFVALGIPLFLFMLYFMMGKDINQIRDIKEQVVAYRDDILKDLKVIKKERESSSKAILSSFKEYNPVYAQIETKSIRQNLESTKPKQDFTDEEYFIIAGTYYIEKRYGEAIASYEKAQELKPSEPLYHFHLGLTYDDEFSSRKFKRGNIDDRGSKLADSAIKHYQKAVDGWDEQDQKVKKALALSNMAYTHLELGKPNNHVGEKDSSEIQKAYNTFEKAESENPDDPFIVFGMAIAAYYLNLYEKAVEHFQEAERREYAEKEMDYHKMYSRLQFRFMREEIYNLFKSPKTRLTRSKQPEDAQKNKK